MNKFLQKLAKIFLGLSMAAGVGVAVSPGKKDISPAQAVATSYTITFNGSASESTQISTSTTAASITGSSSYVTGNVAVATKVYGATSSGVKLGTGSAAGSIKINLSSSGQVTPTSVVIYAKLYSSSKSATLGFNGSTKQSVSSNYSNITFNYTTAITYIQIDVTKYVWVKSVTVNYNSVTDYNFDKTGGTNCTISGPSTGNTNADATFTITPSTSYNAPTSVTVQRGSTTLSQGSGVYAYSVSNNIGTLVIDKSQITGAISISAIATAIVPTAMTLSSTVSTLTASSGNYIVSLATGDTTDGAPEKCYDEDLTAVLTPSNALDKSVTWSYTDASGLIDLETWLDDANELMFRFSTESEGSFVITATSNSGSVVKTVTYNIAQKYTITTNVTNGTKSAGDTEIFKNGSASVTIAPTGDYKLPDSVSVTGAQHTYNSSTGVISLNNPTSNVTISASMVVLTEYTITVNETNSSHTGASTIKESRTASLTFTPLSGYGQPSSVTVSGAASTWTRSTGVLSLSNPTGNVTVTYAAVGNELDDIEISTNSGSYTLGDNFVMPTVTAKYTVNADADVTKSASYSGYDPYTTGNQNVTISYTEGGITKTQSYTATVGAASVTTTTTWELTDLANLTSSDEFVIARTSSTTVALPSNGGAAKPTVSSVTISNNKITSTVTDSILWNVAGNATDGYVFNPKGDSTKWLYLLDDANEGVRIGNGNSAANKHFTLEQGYLYSTETTSPRMIGVYNNADWRCYKLTSGGEPGSNIADQTFGFFKKVETQSGSADLIRITATYKGGDKYVGDSISTSDFTVKKQLNTGNELIDVASGFTISANTLTAESNSITVSYTEGGVTKTATVVVSATEREASLEHVFLNVGENAKLDGYVYWSGAEWDLTDITVTYDWDDDDFDETVDLQDLVDSEDATLSPATPTLGATSFTVSYSYLEKNIENATVTLDKAVVADYVSSVSWSGKSLANFKAFSGQELTASTVNSWTVKATYAGAGETNALSFGTGANQFTIRIGDSKAVTSLPYTWTTADDNEFIYVVVGGVAKGDSTYAKANICATINAIDHDETTTGEQTLSNFIDTSSATWTVTEEGISGGKDDGSSPLDVSNAGFRMESDNGYWNGSQLRSYKYSTFTISSTYTIKSITFTFSGSYSGGLETSYTSINATSKTFADLDSQARITGIAIVYEGSVKTTIHYANQDDHFDAQKAVVTFAKFMNATMNGTNVCSGTFANLESAWDDVADKYDELFGASTTLNETELAWAKKMLEYATAAWGSDAELACVEKAMKTYEHCTSKYELTPFMDGVRSAGAKQVSPLMNVISENTNTVAIIVIISMVSVTAIGGYFFLRKRKENN